jgi:hypothetical protein
MTPAQRLRFDVDGYVLLEGVLSRDECRFLLGLAQRMKADSPYPRQDLAHQTVLHGPAWYERACLELAMDDRLRRRAETLIGSEARLEENEFIIVHPPAPCPASGLPPLPEGWHRGLKPGPASFEADGHYHCLFVKALVYLSDNCEGSGGTWVMPGSHRVSQEVDEFVRAAGASGARQVQARPGDVLLFGETLIHASPRPSFDGDRVILVIGYCAPYMSPWSVESDPPAALAKSLSDEQRRFVYGEARYQSRPSR